MSNSNSTISEKNNSNSSQFENELSELKPTFYNVNPYDIEEVHKIANSSIVILHSASYSFNPGKSTLIKLFSEAQNDDTENEDQSNYACCAE